jgi:hypothetical protein
MKRSLAKRSLTASAALGLMLAAVPLVPRLALAQGMPSQCNDFLKLRADAEQKAGAVRLASEHKAERKEMCTLVERFAASENVMMKFLEDNQSWCGIPAQAIQSAKANHEKTLKFRTVACSDAPAPGRPKAPTLSDAINTPSVDTAKNTKTGRGGTFDTLTGNPLAK